MTTHRMSFAPEYFVWSEMRHRCRNPKHRAYQNYGGRGIRVCERWADFEAFYADMGPRPSQEHSLDRYPDNDGNYEPGNVRWATRTEQANNRRSTRKWTYNGETLSLSEWAERTGIPARALEHRWRWNWDPALAVTLPSRRRA